MVDILYLQVNIIGMIILGVILINQQNVDDGTGRQKAFIALNYSVFITLILDSIMWTVNGKQFHYSIELNWFTASMYYFFNCFNGFVWFLYISAFFDKKKFKNCKYLCLICIPLILNTLLVFLNLKYHMYFYINENNTYRREQFFIFSLFITLPYLAQPFFECLKLYHNTENVIEKKDYLLLMKIHIFPVIGITLQVLFYGISSIWICVVLSLLFIFINFQNKRISTDPLTQLNNRCQFDICLQTIRREMAKDETYSILFIDVDKFKEINDSYGHVFGDSVLISVAVILRKACGKDRVILGRYGGDEFYVFCKTSKKDEIIVHIKENVEEYNKSNAKDIQLSLSIGTSDFSAEESKEAEDIVERADKAMYKNKMK